MAQNKLENVWKILKNHDFSGNMTDKDIFCVLCKRLMINSYNSPCGCRFCLDCLMNYLKEGEKCCPGNTEECKTELLKINENVFYDNLMNTKISKLIVKCPEKCCEFKDELRNIENHLRICNSRSANCPYSNIGCDKTKISQSNMAEHLQVDMISHVNLLINCIDHLTNEIGTLKNENKNLTNKIDEIRLDCDKKEITIQELQTKFNEQNREIDLLNEDMVALRNVDQYLRDDFDELKLDMRRNQMDIAALENKCGQQNEQIEQFKNKYQEVENKFVNTIEERINKEKFKEDLIKLNKIDKIIENGEFLWRIDKIKEKMKDAKNGVSPTIYSDSFYTHKHGYKMCLRVDPDGNGDDKSTYLSVFFYLMKGEFDDDLLWPFKFDLTFSLINQRTHLPHVSNTIKYLRKFILGGYDKPKSEKNIGLGPKNFIKLDELTNSDDLTVNNQIIIKFSININNVNKLLKIEMDQNKQNFGEFLWRIDKIIKKIEDAKNGINTEIYSDSFYTHKHGYKMCLLVDPNGVGTAKDTHLSVHYCLMKGEFDDILEWPFKFDLTLSLINQQTRLAHISRIVKFDLSQIDTFNKPINGRNGAYGYIQFIKLNELLSNESLIKNNQIFIKCSTNITS